MRDGHDDDDGDFGIPPAIVTVIADVCKIGSYALRVTTVTVILGYPAAVIPTGEHPVNATCRRGHYSPFSARKATPAVRKILRFFRLRLQGVTHYTLPCKEPCARRSLWTPLMQGLRPAYPALSASDKRISA